MTDSFSYYKAEADGSRTDIKISNIFLDKLSGLKILSLPVPIHVSVQEQQPVNEMFLREPFPENNTHIPNEVNFPISMSKETIIPPLNPFYDEMIARVEKDPDVNNMDKSIVNEIKSKLNEQDFLDGLYDINIRCAEEGCTREEKDRRVQDYISRGAMKGLDSISPDDVAEKIVSLTDEFINHPTLVDSFKNLIESLVPSLVETQLGCRATTKAEIQAFTDELGLYVRDHNIEDLDLKECIDIFKNSFIGKDETVACKGFIGKYATVCYTIAEDVLFPNDRKVYSIPSSDPERLKAILENFTELTKEFEEFMREHPDYVFFFVDLARFNASVIVVGNDVEVDTYLLEAELYKAFNVFLYRRNSLFHNACLGHASYGVENSEMTKFVNSPSLHKIGIVHAADHLNEEEFLKYIQQRVDEIAGTEWRDRLERIEDFRTKLQSICTEQDFDLDIEEHVRVFQGFKIGPYGIVDHVGGEKFPSGKLTAECYKVAEEFLFKGEPIIFMINTNVWKILQNIIMDGVADEVDLKFRYADFKEKNKEGSFVILHFPRFCVTLCNYINAEQSSENDELRNLLSSQYSKITWKRYQMFNRMFFQVEKSPLTMTTPLYFQMQYICEQHLGLKYGRISENVGRRNSVYPI